MKSDAEAGKPTVKSGKSDKEEGNIAAKKPNQNEEKRKYWKFWQDGKQRS